MQEETDQILMLKALDQDDNCDIYLHSFNIIRAQFLLFGHVYVSFTSDSSDVKRLPFSFQ